MSKRKLRRTPRNMKSASGMATPEEQGQFLTSYNVNDFVQAQRYAETLTQRYPKDAFGWKVLGSCLHKNGRIDAALTALERSLELKEDDAQTQHLTARTLYDLGEPLKALEYAGKAVSLQPDFAQGHFTLAEILTESDQDDHALVHASKAEALGHETSACLFMQSHIHTKRRHYQKAFDTVLKLVEREPDNPFVQNELGSLYKDLGRFEEAESAYRKALSLEPDFDTAFSNLLICMHYNPTVSAEQIFATTREWESHFNQQVNPFTHRPLLSDAGRTIRIGLVSPGFRMHPVGQMILTGLENIQPGFELHFYSTNNADDALTQRLKEVATRWNLVRHLDQAALADRIHEDNIDILIDLSGFGEGSRLRTMSRKPAPLIVKWVGGLINTMGLSSFDYLISDHYETPEGSDHWYSEKLIRMPDDYICYFPAPNAPAIKALPAMSNGHITLGCFNNPAKINPELLGEWARLMHELPDSRLFLKSGQYESTEYCERIRRIMSDHGIEAERLILEGPSNHKELLEAYNRVDIALDTWPYSGGLTTCEAFMMGVPVVTLPGPTFAGRHSATHLINAGMPELVVSSWEEYRQRVVELASDIPNLSVIRACLRKFLTQSPVCDAERFGQHFSNAMRAIWQRHCEGENAAALTLNQQQAFFENSATAFEIRQPVSSDTIQNDFSWELQGKIVAIDNGASLIGNPVINDLLNKEALELVVFDPASRETKKPVASKPGIHYYANNSLGDGQSTTLKATFDPAMSSLLEPLTDHSETDGRRVLARLPFNTVSLDNIDGLPELDWLVIDELSDSATILDHGKQALKSTLLIQIKVAFQPTHDRQPNLAEVQHWACRNGFRFYRLHDLQHRSLMPAGLTESAQPSSELFTAQVLLLPDHERMATLDRRQTTKLAFLLHAVYGLQDAACSLLDNHEEQQQYLATVQKEADKTLLSTPADAQWQPMVREILLANRAITPRAHGLPGELIVSLTSYPGRFPTLWATLQSLLTQTVAPNRVVLWIAHVDKEKLPDNVLSFVGTGLEIHYCEDIRSYKKIVPTLKKWPKAYIATADDDIYYPPLWLEELVSATGKNKKEIAAHRIHKIRLNNKSEVLPYKEWEWNSPHALKADALNFPTSGAGILYPPNCFHEDVTNISLFTDTCPNADDIWLYAMARLNGYSFKHTGRQGFMTWPESQKQALFENNFIGGNDRQLIKLTMRYGVKQIVEKAKGIVAKADNHKEKNFPDATLEPAKPHFDVGDYWNERYKRGGNSGAGSYGRLAIFKAEIINRIIAQHSIASLIEFGCGDGNQLSLFRKDFQYHGIDISEKSVAICREKFRSDLNKSFSTNEEFKQSPEVADATMSLDVIYHLIEDQLYHQYMENLFSSSRRLCIIYAANIDEITRDSHVRKRRFTDWIEKNASEWDLLEYIPNRFPMTSDSDPNNTSFADFYIFHKKPV